MQTAVATFRIPAQITFGIGAAETVGAEAKRLGGSRVLVVSDAGLEEGRHSRPGGLLALQPGDKR